MSTSIYGKYLGDKQVELLHEQSGAMVVTDAPLDNQGLGRSFSATDLVAAALGSCILTIAGIVAERNTYDISGSYFRIEKHMSRDMPRRILSMPVVFHLPASLSAEARQKIERAAQSCPVHHSLHPDVQREIRFEYDV